LIASLVASEASALLCFLSQLAIFARTVARSVNPVLKNNSHPDPKRKRTGLRTRLSCKIEYFPTPDQADCQLLSNTSQATNGFALA
jgi:hypothetical protein